MNKLLDSVVEVTFLVPGQGATKEIYDLRNASDIVAWKSNNKLANCIQLSVKTLDQIEATEQNIAILAAAQEAAVLQLKQARAVNPVPIS